MSGCGHVGCCWLWFWVGSDLLGCRQLTMPSPQPTALPLPLPLPTLCRCCREVSERYPEIEYEEMIVDNTCMQVGLGHGVVQLVWVLCWAAAAEGVLACLPATDAWVHLLSANRTPSSPAPSVPHSTRSWSRGPPSST